MQVVYGAFTLACYGSGLTHGLTDWTAVALYYLLNYFQVLNLLVLHCP